MSSSTPVIRGKSLYTVVSNVTWQEAEKRSKEIGGNLITFTNKEELFFIQDTILSDDK